MNIIALDPGHGGTDLGARGRMLCEARLVMQVAREAARALVCCLPDTFVCLLRRTHDHNPTLAERNAEAIRVGASLIISIHANASAAQTQTGALALYWPGNPMGKDIANVAAHAYPLPLQPPARDDNRATPAMRATYPRARALLAAYQATTVLIELGHIDHPLDEQALMMAGVRDGISASILAAAARWSIINTPRTGESHA